ncbi:hypothetical protein [Massilia haematophila]|uniref:Uncharacterized protein n=1 Tax=Massilia haematophila TaxID=457923 RepID=A0ABV7PLB5_9BURK
MMKRWIAAPAALVAALLINPLLAQGAWAALAKPALTPEQQQAAAAKKAEADAKAAKDKELLSASMDAVSARWRSQAASKGWKINPPTAIAQAPAPGIQAPGTAAPAGGAPGVGSSGVTPPNAGVVAAAPANAAPGTSAAAPGRGAAPLSPQALQSANVPIKSEKLGTAAPSEDVKKAPTKSVPKGASPAVDKGNADAVQNK